MYLDPRFKQLLMLTERQKKAVQSAVKVELTSTILQEREDNLETEQTATQSESTTRSCAEQLEEPQPKRTKLEKFLMVLLDQGQEKMVLLQRLLKQNYKSTNLRNQLV